MKYNQKINITRTFEKTKQAKFWSIADSIDTGLIVNAKGGRVSVKNLWSIGLEKHSSEKIGSGTLFHNIYDTNAELYHQFSLAEDPKNILYRMILKFSAKNKLQTVLDVGCGTGKLGNKLGSTFRKIYLLDKSKMLLDKARKINTHTERTEFLLSKAENIPLLDNSVDLCLSTWASFSSNEALYEMERVVRHGGYIIKIGTCEKDELTSLYPGFAPAHIARHLGYMKEQGFVIKKQTIDISFPTLSVAKEVLSKITGCNPNDVKTKRIQHVVAVQTKKVMKRR